MSRFQTYRTNISLVQEMSGRTPNYPLNALVDTQIAISKRQEENINKLSKKTINQIKKSSAQMVGSMNRGFNELQKATERVAQVTEEGFMQANQNLQKGNEIMEVGFAEVSNELAESNTILRQIDKELIAIHSTLDWSLGELIVNSRISNDNLERIIQLLNIPDSQKQRKYHVERGMEFLSKTKFSVDFYNDSVFHFLKAIEIEPSDYHSNYQIGKIHLYSNDNLSLKKAADYLKQGLKYSLADIDFNRDEGLSMYMESFEPRSVAALSNLHLARINYIEEDIAKALKYAEDSYNILESPTAEYDLLKYNCLAENHDKAIAYLRKVLGRSELNLPRLLSDSEIVQHDFIHNELDLIYQEAKNILNKEIQELESLAKNNKSATALIENHKMLILLDDNYLNVIKTLKELGFEKNGLKFSPTSEMLRNTIKVINERIDSITCELTQLDKSIANLVGYSDLKTQIKKNLKALNSGLTEGQEVELLDWFYNEFNYTHPNVIQTHGDYHYSLKPITRNGDIRRHLRLGLKYNESSEKATLMTELSEQRKNLLKKRKGLYPNKRKIFEGDSIGAYFAYSIAHLIITGIIWLLILLFSSQLAAFIWDASLFSLAGIIIWKVWVQIRINSINHQIKSKEARLDVLRGQLGINRVKIL